MTDRTLSAYEVTISRRNKPAVSLPLDNFDGKGSSFLSFYASFIAALPANRLIKDGKFHYGEPTGTTLTSHSHSCRITSGTSGIISRFRKPNRSAAFDRSAADVEEIDYGVMATQPANSHVGFLVIETAHGRTLTRAFRTKLTAEFKKHHPNAILSLGRTAEVDAWREAEAAADRIGVKQITAIERGIPASVMQANGLGNTTREFGVYERVFKFRKEPESGSILARARNHMFPQKEGGTLTTRDDSDGGANDNEVDELIAQIATPEGEKRIRCSGARPPYITYPCEVRPGETHADAFSRNARSVVIALVSATGCRLAPGWDTDEWGGALTVLEVDEFANVAPDLAEPVA